MTAAVLRATGSGRLALFFVATFAWTWGFYIPIAATGNSPYGWPWLMLLILGGMGPSLIGIAMIVVSRPRWRDIVARWFDPRRLDGPSWLLVLALVPVIYWVAVALCEAFGIAAPGAVKLEALLAAPGLWVPTLVISFMSGPWSEEFGWRGFALEPMLARFGLVAGSVALGVIWGLWHLPLYFMPGTWHHASGLGLTGLWSFVLGNVGLSLIISWVYLRSGGSVLSAILLHFAINIVSQLLAPIAVPIEVMVDLGLAASGLALCTLAPPDRAKAAG